MALLGPGHVQDNLVGGGVAFPEKGFALVAYLSLEHTDAAARREEAALFLWNEREQTKAVANLRSLLARIRRVQNETGLDLVAADREYVWLTTAAVDVRRLCELAGDQSTAAVRELCEIYRGDLLEDFDGSDLESGAWLRTQRTAMRDLFVGAVTRYLEREQPDLEGPEIEAAAQKLISVDPYQEAPYRALMRIYAAAGRLRDLERIYRACRARFEQDLGVRPDGTILRLYRELLSRDTDDIGGPTSSIAVKTWPEPPNIVQPSSHAAPRPPGICVLMPPLSGGEPVFELAAAVLEDVTIGLCRQRTFAVFAPFTAWRLGSDGPESDFVQKHGIDYVVQTRIQESGGDHFLTAKLLDASSRKIAWADRFAFRTTDPGQSYHNLSHRIVASLSEEIANAEIDRYRRDGDASAYVAYLLGTRALATLQLPGIRSARALFKASIRQDRGFAPALGGLARTLHMEWLLLARGEPDLLHQAEVFSRRALDADPECADGLRELGLCLLYSGKFDESLGALAEAERRNPQHADLLADYADALSLGGQPADALKKIDHATALNPLCPDHYRWYQGTIQYQLEQYEAAIDALSRMGDSSPAYKLIAACWAMLGETSKARDYARKVLQIYPEFTVGKWLSMIPIRDAALKRHYEQGLRAAGFN